MELPQTSLDKLTAAFKALGVQAPSLLTKIGILRSLIIEIDAAKKDGYSYGLILETLITNGLKKTTLNQFYGLMNRIRLERGFTNLTNQTEKKIAPASPGLLDGEFLTTGNKIENKMKEVESLISNEKIALTPGKDRISQEELKAAMRTTVDPNEFLE